MSHAQPTRRSSIRSLFSRQFRRRARRAETTLRSHIESLENRQLLAASATLVNVDPWSFQGPSPILNGQVAGMLADGTNPVTGAVRTIAVQPDNPATASIDESQIAYVGAVNGGVWRTTNFRSGSSQPTWTSMTDDMPSLAIGAVAISPKNPNFVYVGTGSFSSANQTGGAAVGLYRTTEGNRLDKQPKWEHLTNPTFNGLAITSILLYDNDVNRIMVGTQRSGSRGGIFISNDSGVSWLQVSGSFNAPDGIDNNGKNGTDEPGEHNDADLVDNNTNGQTDEADELNIPIGTVTDLAYDRLTGLVYAGIRGKGIYRSVDFGVTWEDIGMNTSIASFSPVTNIKFTLQKTHSAELGDYDVLTAAIVDQNGELGAILRTTDLGETWTGIDLPETSDYVDKDANGDGTIDISTERTTKVYGLLPGKQGKTHLSILGDPNDPSILYMGGDRQPIATAGNAAGLDNFTGRIFRGVVSASGVTWTQVVGNGTSDGSAPHADSRAMVMIPGFSTIYEADDGGIYELFSPDSSAARRWRPRNGNLAITEVGSVAYDSTNKLFIAGNQDVGSIQQQSKGGSTWSTLLLGTSGGSLTYQQGDGGNQTVDPADPRIYYSMANNYNSLYRLKFSAVGTQVDLVPDDTEASGEDLLAQQVKLSGLDASDRDFKGYDHIPFVFNAINFNQVATGYNVLYESSDKGETLTPLEYPGAAGTDRSFVVRAIAYGGREPNLATADPNDFIDHPEVLYVARSNNIAVRRAGEKQLTPRTAGTTVFGLEFGATVVGVNLGTPEVIHKIVVNPDNWKVAYAVGGDDNVYKTSDGGQTWAAIAKTVTSGAHLQSLELYNPSPAPDDEVILAGGSKGVFRGVNDGAGGVLSWVKMATGLPNVTVMDLHYDTTGDILYVGTFGRGVWSLSHASTTMDTILRVEGVNDNTSVETIRLAMDSADKTRVIVTANGTSLGSFPLSIIERIDIRGNGGPDVIEIDNTNGVIAPETISKAAFIKIFGGAGSDKVRLIPAAASGTKMIATITNPNASGTGSASITSINPNTYAKIDIKEVEQPIESLIQTPTAALDAATTAISAGISTAADSLGGIPGVKSTGAFVNSVLGAMDGSTTKKKGRPTGTSNGPSSEEEEESEPVFDTEPFVDLGFSTGFGGQLFRRIFESGTNAFALSEIGGSIANPALLAQRLDDLDESAGNVTFATTNGITLFDVRIDKTLTGLSHIEPQALGGLVALDLDAEFTADVHLHMVFGVDAAGFFITAEGSPTDHGTGPVGEFTIDHISGEFEGTGRVGFLEVEADLGTITVDPNVTLVIDLIDPDADTPDGLIRVDDLLGDRSSMVTVDINGDPGDAQPDLTMTAEVGATLFHFDALDGLPLSLQWSDINQLNQGVALVGTPGDALLNFLNADFGQIVSAINGLSGAIQQLTGVDVLATKIPLLNKSIGDVLNSTPEDVAVPAASVVGVSSISPDADSQTFTVFVDGFDLVPQGAIAGGSVSYRNTANSVVQGTIDLVDGERLVIRTALDSNFAPSSTNLSLSLHRDGSLQSRLQGLFGGISTQIPTLQELVERLSDLTGVELFEKVVVTGSLATNDLAFEIPLTYDPGAVTYQQSLDFGAQIAGLTLDAGATFQVSIDPSFDVTIGVRLGAGLAPAERIYLKNTTGAHLANLVVTAKASPDVNGSIGFLNVHLGNDPSVGTPADPNEGIEINLTTSLDLKDPSTGLTTVPVSLTTIASSPLQSFRINAGGFLDLDGLALTASIGDASALGTLRISLDGESGPNAVGRIQGISDLQRLFGPGSFQIQGSFGGALQAFQNFQNITPEQILAALDAIIDQLTAAGSGAVFQKPIPVVNQSLADLVDLGQAFLAKVGDPTGTAVATAQQLVSYLNSKLGSAANVQLVETPTDVRISFTFAPDAINKTLPFAFDLGSNVSLVSVSASGGISLHADYAVQVSVGILTDSTKPLAERIFFDTDHTQVSAHALASAGYDINDDGLLTGFTNAQGQFVSEAAAISGFNVSVGPLQISVRDARVLLDLLFAGGISEPSGDHRLTTKELSQALSAGQVSTLFSGAFNGELQAIVPLDGNGDNLVSANPASLNAADARIELGGRITNGSGFALSFTPDLPHHIGATVTGGNAASSPDLSDPLKGAELPTGSIRIFTHNVTGLIQNSLLNFQTLIDGVKKFIEWGQKVLGLDILDVRIPFVGKTIGEGFDFFGSNPKAAGTVRAVLDALVSGGSGSLGANLTNEQVFDAANVLRDILKTIPGVRVIGDGDRDGVVESQTVANASGKQILVSGDDLLRLERGPAVTSVGISGATVQLFTSAGGTANDSVRVTLAGRNFGRDGIAVDDVVRYTVGSVAATGRVKSVDATTLTFKMDTPANAPTSSTIFNVDAHKQIVGATFLIKFQPGLVADLFSIPKFDLGLDFLKLSGDAALAFKGDLTLLLGFGISKQDGFYVKTDFTDVGVPSSTPEVLLDGGIQLSGNTAVKLGLLDLRAQFDPVTNFMKARLSVDLNGGAVPGDKLLTLSELLDLPSIPQRITVGFELEGHLNAALSVDAGSQLPSLGAQLVIDWGPFQPTQTRPIPDPTIHLNNISIDLASFLDKFTRPLFEVIRDHNIIPAKVLDFLNSELPLLDQTPRELISNLLTGDTKRVFDFLFSISQTLTSVTSNTSTATTNAMKLNYGSITVGRDAATGAPKPNTSTGNEQGSASGSSAVNGQQKPDEKTAEGLDIPGSGLPLIGSFLKDLGDIGIFFPFLRLSNLSQLLVGNPIDLAFVNLKPLHVEKQFNQSFPILGVDLSPLADFSVSAFLGGGFTVDARLAAGFDTSGLKNGSFLDGFYLGDFDPRNNGQIDADDPERFEVAVTAFAQAGIDATVSVLNFDVARATGFFKINGSVHADLNDDNEDANGVLPECDDRTDAERRDGKLHLGELATIVHSRGNNPIALVDLGGTISAELGLHVTVAGGLLFDQQFSKIFPVLDLNVPPPAADCPDDDTGGGGTGGGGGGTGGGGITPTIDVATPIIDNTTKTTGIKIATKEIQETLNRIGRIDRLVNITLEDLNDDPYDGPDLGQLNVADVVTSAPGIKGLFTITDPSNNGQYSGQGIVAGQGITWVSGGVTQFGTVVGVTGNSLTIQPLSASINHMPDSRTTYRVKSGRETMRVEQNGFVTRFGPSQKGQFRVDDITSLTLITTGDDVVNGLGAGNDRVFIDPLIRTNTMIATGAGDDMVIAGSGHSTLMGGSGDDVLSVAPAPTNLTLAQRLARSVHIEGGSGRDRISGSPGDDDLLGGGDDDIIDGGAGLFGGIFGPSGRDLVIGGGGADVIDGRDGDDILIGDYDATFDPRPGLASQRHEGADTIRTSGGLATIWGDNRGSSSIADGPAPDSGLDVADTIAVGLQAATVFAGAGDDLDRLNASGALKINALGQTVAVSPNSVTLGAGKPIRVGAKQTVEIVNAAGMLAIVGDRNSNTITLSAVSGGIGVTFTGGVTFRVSGSNALQVAAGGGDDTLTLDLTAGNPIPAGGLKFDGSSQMTSTGDVIRIIGTGAESASLTVGKGSVGSSILALGSGSISFRGAERFGEVSRLATLQYITPAGADALILGGAQGTLGQTLNTLTGSSDQTSLVPISLFDVSDLRVDTGQNDGALADDVVTVSKNWSPARGLRNLSVLTGAGNDRLDVNVPSFLLDVAGGAFTFNGGLGVDTIRATNNVNYTLAGDTSLASSGGGSLNLVGLAGEAAELTGGASANTFTLTNWTGTATLDGGAGADFLVLTMTGGTVTTLETLSLAANVTTNAASAPATINGTLDLGTVTRTFTVNDGAASNDLVINAKLVGATAGVGLTKAGTGTLQLGGDSANSYTGATTVNAGTLLLNKSAGVAVPGSLVIGDGVGGTSSDVVRWLAGNQLASTSPVTVAASGLLDLANQSGSAGAIGLTGGNIATGTGTLTLNGNLTSNASTALARVSGKLDLGATARTFSVAGGGIPVDLEVAAAIQGTGGLAKTGTGTLLLSGNNPLSGPTTVANGTARVTGSLAASPLTLTGGRLAGTGTVRVASTSGGILGPGINQGILTSSGGTTLGPGVTFETDLPGTTPGTGHDQLKILGTVNLNGAKLFILSGSTAVGDTFRIIDNDGTDAVVGTFNGLAEGATYTDVIDPDLGLSLKYRVSYRGGDGNDVVLTRTNTTSALRERNVTAQVETGQVATLAGRILEPDFGDEFHLRVDWGDGSPVENFVFAPGTPTVALKHVYVNNDPTKVGGLPRTVSLAWTDQHAEESRTAALNLVVLASPNRRYVDRIYRDLLGRGVEPEVLVSWSNRLESGWSRERFVTAILRSPEYGSRLIEELTQRYLRRAATSDEVRRAQTRVSAGASAEQLAATLLSSSEYFRRQGGGTGAGFLNALYRDVLGRSVDARTRALLLGRLAGNLSVSQLVEDLLASQEYRAKSLRATAARYLHIPLGTPFDERPFAAATAGRSTVKIMTSNLYFTRND
ncbi:MAG: autotransporter-associated beta strand repeat-containing protein [Isosphaeraceae bacterium]